MRKTVLIIDDSPTEMSHLTGIMKKAGYTISSATSGEEGLAKAQKEKPELILLDVIMGGKNGFVICRELKKDPSTKDSKVIICSTKGQESDVFWGIKQGADGYLAKPFGEDQLLNEIKKVFS